MKPTDPAAAEGRHHYTPEELHNQDVAHEHSDINVRAIVIFLVGLAVVGAVVHVLMWGLFVVFERMAAANDPQPSPLSAPATVMPRTTTASPAFGGGPSPQLLTNEPAALRQFRAEEEQMLHGYGWVDERAGVARMPIEEAKKLLAGRGVPARPEGVGPGVGTWMPAYGESSSGRLVTGPPRGAGLPEIGGGHGSAAEKKPAPDKGGGH